MKLSIPVTAPVSCRPQKSREASELRQSKIGLCFCFGHSDGFGSVRTAFGVQWLCSVAVDCGSTRKKGILGWVLFESGQFGSSVKFRRLEPGPTSIDSFMYSATI